MGMLVPMGNVLPTPVVVCLSMVCFKAKSTRVTIMGDKHTFCMYWKHRKICFKIVKGWNC